jgi:hypothetical protein
MKIIKSITIDKDGKALVVYVDGTVESVSKNKISFEK